jgi:RNA recognition motif-containing protein
VNIYVGNISHMTTERQLRQAFARYGTVGKISVDYQVNSSTSYNFCFVEMPCDSEAVLAIAALGGRDLGGQVLVVRESGLVV